MNLDKIELLRLGTFLCVCVCLKLLGPVTPVLDALVTPRGYTVAAQVAHGIPKLVPRVSDH